MANRHEVPSVSWSTLLERYRPLAVRFATGLVGSAEAGEDLVQDVSQGLWARVSAGELTFESDAHARNYFFQSLRRRAVDRLRSGAHAPTSSAALDALPAPGPGPEDEAQLREARATQSARRERMRAAIEALRPVESEAIRLRFQEGLGFREMAEHTGISISTWHARVQVALKKIRTRIEREGGEP